MTTSVQHLVSLEVLHGTAQLASPGIFTAAGAAAGEGEGREGSRRECQSSGEGRTSQGNEEVLTLHWWDTFCCTSQPSHKYYPLARREPCGSAAREEPRLACSPPGSGCWGWDGGRLT